MENKSPNTIENVDASNGAKENTSITSPFVFISHDSRDADLAKAFGELLKKASIGVVKYFCSSDRTGKEGIEYGSEWYPTIKENIEKASDVVCLLTERSVTRPWLLYEAGMALGKNKSKVLGLVLGADMKVATEGPFAQFQNCLDDKDSIVKLVMQLVRRVPNAEPDSTIITPLVEDFLKKEKDVLKEIKIDEKSKKKTLVNESEMNSSAKLFEEIKLMFSDLSTKLNRDFPDLRRQKNRNLQIQIEHMRCMNFPPRLMARIGLCFYKDLIPWVYEEGCFLLNLLLNSKGNAGDSMRLIHDILKSTRYNQIELMDFYCDFDMINHIILESFERIAWECEKKSKK